jgi:hypothetical protein
MDPEPLNPYATPAVLDSPAVAGSLPAGTYGGYRDNRILAKWLTGLLVFGMTTHLVRGGLDLAYTLTSFGSDGKRAMAIERVMEATWITAIACMIVFGTWIVRTGKNAWLFAGIAIRSWRSGRPVPPKSPQDTPGWALGWYFIPIASFWKPYVAMREIVNASTVREGLPRYVLPVWWALWILSLFTDNATGYAQNVGDAWKTGASAVALTSVSGVHAALHAFAIVLVRAVTALQADTAAELAITAPGESAPPVTA